MRANPSKPDSYTLRLMWDAISDKPVASFGMVKGSYIGSTWNMGDFGDPARRPFYLGKLADPKESRGAGVSNLRRARQFDRNGNWPLP